MVGKYIPKQGDVCYVDFSPTSGHEQTGIRPGVVVSRDSFNKYTGMALLCPITNNTKVFASHYLLTNTKKVQGSVLCEQLRSFDYNTCNLKLVEKLDIIELNENH